MSGLEAVATGAAAPHRSWQQFGGGLKTAGHVGGTSFPTTDGPYSGPPTNLSVGQSPYAARNSMVAQLDQLEAFFGLPRRDARAQAQAEDADLANKAYRVEQYDYPQAFNMGWGKNGEWTDNSHVATILIEKVTATQAIFISYMAPWHLDETGSMKIGWTLMTYSQSVLDKLPEQSIPRMATSTTQRFEETLSRYGMMCISEATFFETPWGKHCWYMQLEQIKWATVETACAMAAMNILEAEPVPLVNAFTNNGNSRELGVQEVSNLFSTDIEMFGILHKRREGVSMLQNRMRKVFSSRSRTPNFQVCPKGAEVFLEEPDRRFYLDGNDGGTDLVQKATKGGAIASSRSFSTGIGTPTFDPFFRPKAIGEFVTLNDQHVRHLPADKYKTQMLDRMVYCRGDDKFRWIRYEHSYKLAGVWNFNQPEAPATALIGGSLFRDMGVYTWGQLYRSGAGGTDKVVSALAALPAHKQAEFYSCLRLVDEKETEIIRPREDTVPVRQWSSDTFAHMCDLVSDGQAQRYDLSVGDVRRNAPYLDFGAVGLGPFHDLSWSLTQQQTADPADVAKRRREEGVDAYAREQLAQYDQRQRDGDTAGSPGPQSMSVREKIQALINNIAEHPVAQWSAMGLNTLNSDSAVHPPVHRVLRGEDTCLTDDSRLRVLSEVKSTLDTAKAVDSLKDDVANYKTYQKNTIAAYKVHLLKAIKREEIKDAMLQIEVERLGPLEKLVLKNSGDTQADYPSDVQQALSINWDGSEDSGQVSTAFCPFFADTGMAPLAYDAYAATLAYRHDLVINVPAQVQDLAQIEQVKGNKARKNGLAFSALLSMLLAVAAQGAKTNAAPAMAGTLSAGGNQLKAVLNTLRKSFYTGADDLHKVLIRANDHFKLRNSIEAKTIPSQSFLTDAVTHARGVIQALFAPLGAPAAAGGQVSYGTPITDADIDRMINRVVAATSKNPALEYEAVMQPGFQIDKAAQKELETRAAAAAKQVAAAAAAAGAVVAPAAPAAHPSLSSGSAAIVKRVSWSPELILSLLNCASIACGLLWRFFVENNIPQALALRASFPIMTYDMGCWLMMTAGKGGAATTYVKKPHFMMAANAGQKMMYGNFSTYMKTVVKDREAIFVQQNTYCRGIVGGCGLQINDPLNPEHVTQWALYDSSECKDGFVQALPMNESVPRAWWQSLSGRMPDTMKVSQEVANTVHFKGADGFRQHWSIQPDEGDYSAARRCKLQPGAYTRENRTNTILMQGHEFYYQPETGKYDGVETCSGHWGRNSCYEGAADVLNGAARIFDIPDHVALRQIRLV